MPCRKLRLPRTARLARFRLTVLTVGATVPLTVGRVGIAGQTGERIPRLKVRYEYIKDGLEG